MALPDVTPRKFMPFEYRRWRLYLREVKPKRAPPVTIYYFSRKKPLSGRPSDIPPGKAVAVNADVGYPFLIDAEPSLSPQPVAGCTFEDWTLYEGDVRDEETGQMVRSRVFCRSWPKGFVAAGAMPPGRRPAWHPETDLPFLQPTS